MPIFSVNTSTPVECNQHYRYGLRGRKALSIPDFALFSALAYESEPGLLRGLRRDPAEHSRVVLVECQYSIGTYLAYKYVI